MTASEPLLVIDDTRSNSTDVESYMDRKILASSLTRTMFSGDILIVTANANLIFKVERKNVTEITGYHGKSKVSRIRSILERIDCDPERWIVSVDAASIAMRSIEHLFDAAKSVDPGEFLWQPAAKSSGRKYSSKFWAVKKQHINYVDEIYKDFMDEHETDENDDRIWDLLVDSLVLKKRRFETGEVYLLEGVSIDWKRVFASAITILPKVPYKDRWEIAQAIYLAKFYGDFSGKLINLLES